MSDDTVAQRSGAPTTAPRQAVPAQGVPQQPQSLLQQMEELMAALNADLSALDADLQSATGQPPAERDDA